jgi:transcriptional repressor NrdR
MNCPYCGHDHSRVIDTREVPDGIRRRRECLECRQRFTTYERLAGVSLLVVKRDNSREEFDRDKLLKSLHVACHKRQISAQQLELAARDIETDLYAMGRGEISSRKIGELVMNKLQDLDEVAYVRFASVYRSFQDVDSMAEEIENLQARKRREAEQKNQIPLPLDNP